MAESDPLNSGIATVPVPELGPDVYTNKVPFTALEGVVSVFGGYLVSQAVTAASATLPPSFAIYSSQSTFLRPGDNKKQVTYWVERVLDGRAYATRVVHARQGDVRLCIAVLAFQNTKAPSGRSLEYGAPMPDLDGLRPEDIDKESFARDLIATNAPSAPIPKLHPAEPFDWRPLALERPSDPVKYRYRGFARARSPIRGGMVEQLAAFAYMSDKWLLGAVINANSKALGPMNRNLAMMATLTHQVSFHDPSARVDEWLVAERETSWGARGRVAIHQKVWNASTGRLVMSCTQEAVVRLKGSKL
jgi:acyl-CoA thioesterase-2